MKLTIYPTRWYFEHGDYWGEISYDAYIFRWRIYCQVGFVHKGWNDTMDKAVKDICTFIESQDGGE